MLSAQAYLELVRNRGERGLQLERVYHNLRNPDLFLMAYGRLYAKSGAMTTGVDPKDSIDGMSTDRIQKVIESLANGKFRWKPSKRIYIPKANGKFRPIGIPGWTDKLVQEAMRLILEAYYEPQFSDLSHGFRPNRGCHTTLSEIKIKWSGTNWFIEGDITGCFDNINWEKLLETIGRHIKDDRFLELLREMLKAGYMEDWRYHDTYSGTPQGGVISPLLANIYLNELDRFIENELIPKYSKGIGQDKEFNPVYRSIAQKAKRARKKKNWQLAEELGKKQRRTPSMLANPNFRRLKYQRYADDFILGLIGTKEEAQQIEEEIRQFLLTFKLDLSVEKTKVTHAATERARFLGYEINVERVDSQRAKTYRRRSINGQIALRIPKDVIEKWTDKYQENGKPIHLREMVSDTDYDIVTRFNMEIRGLVNYYALATNIRMLNKVKYVYQVSLVKTLANKHKQRITWVYRKYSKKTPEGKKVIEVKVEREGKEPLIARFGAFPIQTKKYSEIRNHRIEDRISKSTLYNKRTQLETRLLANECELCGSKENVEVHHIRSIKTLIQKNRKKGTEMPEWEKHMAETFRKTLIVCRKCHEEITHGRYDGRKLS